MNDEPWRQISLEGVVDFHVHTAPDNRPRWHTALELAEKANRDGMAGFVVKSHHEPTATRAAEARTKFPNLSVHGGVTLNRAAGGIDARMVAEVLASGGRVVWLPTLDGRGQSSGPGANDGLAVVDTAGHVPGELIRVFEIIAEHDAILATGHVAANEILPAVRSARRAGVRRILVNHPEIPFLSFSVDLQKQLRDEGVLLERCYPRPEAEDGFAQIAHEIRSVGVPSTILATDLGRRDLPPPMHGLRRMIHELEQRGFDEQEIATMTRVNPVELLAS